MAKKDDEEKKEPKNITRRQFVKSAGALGGGLVLSSALGGCASEETSTQEAPTQTSAPPPTAVPAEPTIITREVPAATERPFQVYDTDVLVIGGGLAGMFAARKVISDGGNVIIVDKGPFGHSGTSGINWGHDMETNEWSSDDGSGSLPLVVLFNDGVVDQEYCLSLCQNVHEAKPIAWNARVGGIAERDKDGEPIGKNADTTFVGDHGCFPRMFAQYARRSGAKIVDRTMITSLLKADGACVGAAGVDLVSGEFKVFRAKATIMATGSYAWCYGWRTTGAATIAGPENTGDGHSLLLNEGLEFMDMEQLPFDCVQVYPEGTGSGMGTMGLSVVNQDWAVNSEGEYYVRPWVELGPEKYFAGNSQFMRLTMREILEGRGSPGRGVWVDLQALDTFDRYYRFRRDAMFKGLGYMMPDQVEVVPEFWESAGRPHLTTEGETPIPGLYFATANDMTYGGLGFFGSVGSGYMTGKGAVKRAAEVGAPLINWEQVQQAANYVYGILEAEPSEKVRPHVVYHAIQHLMYENLQPLRDEEGIMAAIEELERIKAQEFPKIWISSKSRNFNTEWRRALEIPNMWNCVMGTAQSALVRKETRGTHCRTDYPSMDNTNWLKNVWVKIEDGNFITDIRPIVAPYLTEDQIRGMLPELGLDTELPS
jgi:succinate dehydrogenase/fumarate reductase flavoprotein subunit